MDETLQSNSEVLPFTANSSFQAHVDDGDQHMSDFTPNVASSLPQAGGFDSGSDSDSDSDSDSNSVFEGEEQQKLQLQTLESDLSINPSNYDAHVQYIKLLRYMGNIEKLRKAREAMSEIFPLTAAMWQEWAKDEVSLSTGPDALIAIEKLYERGVVDYLSVSLWCDYLNFVQEYDPSIQQCSFAGVSKARDLFERAITAAGLHVTEGDRVWEAYREFEQAISLTVEGTDGQEKERQTQRIRSIFHRQLSLPLVNIKSTFEAYKIWEGSLGHAIDMEHLDLDGKFSNVVSAHQKALKLYDSRSQLEEQISKKDISDAERLQQFMIYIKFEQSTGDIVRVQVLFERAISEFPISSDLWLEYTRYMDENLKVGNNLRSVYSRATQNCPWVGELWVRYLLTLERGHASEKEIAAVFEKSMQCLFSSIKEYLDLFLTRVDGLRRRMSSVTKGENVLDYKLIREAFQRATEYLSPHLKNTESLLHLYAYWAHVELSLGNDLVAARGVWESMLKICGTMLEAWLGYIEMEIKLNNINEARSIYKRCYSKRFPRTGSEDICHSWLRFERKFGSLKNFDFSERKVNSRLEEIQSFRLQLECKSTELENPIEQKGSEKRKSGPDVSDYQSSAKRQKAGAQKPKKSLGKDDLQLQNMVEQARLERRKAKIDGVDSRNDQEIKDSIAEKAKVYNDKCTAFVSNLDLKANNEHLHDFFVDVGGVVAIRILRDKFTGKSRGLAYIDFCSDAHLNAAVAKNRQLLLGKKVSIAKSDPKRLKNESAGRTAPRDPGKGSASNDIVEASKNSKNPQTLQPSLRKPGGDRVQLQGKNTFAVPRNVRPLGRAADKPTVEEEGDGIPKSNNEFRKMFIKD